MDPKIVRENEELGERAAACIRVTPQQVEYIEARGCMCHELLYLLGGSIGYCETPWREFTLKMLEFMFPISPICRWYPPEDHKLEVVGCHPRYETKAYRLKPREGPATVFFAEFRPEPPAFGGYVRPLFNMPRLDLGRLLSPPLDDSYADNNKNELLLRSGVQQGLTPLPVTQEVLDCISDRASATNRGLWKGLSEDPADPGDVANDS
jgi:hypothetical protein